MKKLFSALAWLAVIFCFLCLPAHGFHVCNIFFTLSGILFIPEGRLGRALNNNLKIKPAFIYLAATVFLALGIFIAPWAALSGENVPAQTAETSFTASSSSHISITSAHELQSSLQTTQTIQSGHTTGQTIVTSAPQTTAQTTSHTTVQTTPIATTYVLNVKNKKIHYPSCSAANRISDANRAEHTGDFSELLAQGYTTCGICFK